uniref:CD200 molecule n=1 Tax=Hypotaenidia okinawae TaxID=2861861 RepID=A0A6G1S2P7_9GRUI
MTLRALFFSLVYLGLGKAKVVPQAEHRNVTVGESVTLSCVLTEPEDVLQVTWQKDSEKPDNNIATYSTSKGLRIREPYRGRMNFTSLVLNKTSITLWDTRMEDSGCYLCLFNAFPFGSFSGRICMTVFGLNGSVHYNISDDRLVATCSAFGFPEPTITWSNLFSSSPTQEVVRHAGGMVSITSKLEVHNTQGLGAQDLTCRISNANKELELPVRMAGEEAPVWPWLLIAVTVVTVVVLIVVCWKRRICRTKICRRG